jgi:hypothetical protein
MGKIALLTAWLARREAAGTAVPHHSKSAAASTTGTIQHAGTVHTRSTSEPERLAAHLEDYVPASHTSISCEAACRE